MSTDERIEHRAIVVDDDEDVCTFVELALGFEGFRVDTAGTAAEARVLLGANTYDLVILDVTLPSMSGVTFLRELRETPDGHDVAVMMFSGHSESAFVVIALEAGADEYCTKPVVARELALRARMAIDRRREHVAAPTPGDPAIVCGALTIDPDCRIVTIDGRDLDLTAKEFDLLVVLAQSPGKVFDRIELLDLVWDAKPDWQSIDTVTEHVYRLRQKLDAGAGGRSWIQTMRGAGYRLDRRRAEETSASATELLLPAS